MLKAALKQRALSTRGSTLEVSSPQFMVLILYVSSSVSPEIGSKFTDRHKEEKTYLNIA